MKLVSFLHNGTARAGILHGTGDGAEDLIVDLAHPSVGTLPKDLAPQLADFLSVGFDRIISALVDLGDTSYAQLPLSEVRLLAPIPRPRRIFGIAHNYRDALAERGLPLPAEPVLFMKGGDTVVGPDDAVVLPEGIGGCTYEAELAAVIGRRATNVPVEEALSHVAAYGAFNDISASEMIRREGNFERGKNFPTFGPFGPFLRTADDVADPQSLGVQLSVDGVVLQHSSTAQMLFPVAELISILSHMTVLEPGDIIATGTPAGVAPVRKPPTWLKPGSTLEASVEGLGILRNPVVAGGSLDD